MMCPCFVSNFSFDTLVFTSENASLNHKTIQCLHVRNVDTTLSKQTFN